MKYRPIVVAFYNLRHFPREIESTCIQPTTQWRHHAYLSRESITQDHFWTDYHKYWNMLLIYTISTGSWSPIITYFSISLISTNAFWRLWVLDIRLNKDDVSPTFDSIDSLSTHWQRQLRQPVFYGTPYVLHLLSSSWGSVGMMSPCPGVASAMGTSSSRLYVDIPVFLFLSRWLLIN